MPLSVEERAAKVDAIIFDVDGVLTDGGIIHGPGGEWKVFNVQDGHGFKLAQRAGLKLGMLTGRRSKIVERRAKELGVGVVAQGVRQKGEAIAKILDRLGIKGEQACYVGDDLVDLPAMRQVGLPVAVANAVDEVKEGAVWVTEHRGGEGAAREVIEMILKSKGLWKDIMKRYIEVET